MAKQLLYPERMRCRTCRNFFDWTVLDRLYCSRKCAGLPPEPPKGEAPRQCVSVIGNKNSTTAANRHGATFNGKKWAIWKRRFWTPEEAQEVVESKAGANLSAYYCDNCHTWHVGHKSDYDGPVFGRVTT